MKTDFSKIFINGEWTSGSSDSQMKNTNPFTGEELVTTQAADKNDLDAAYKAAETAQLEWAKELPQAKQAVMEKAIEVMKENKELIIEWLIKEAGSTKIKATVEFGASMNILKEAATFPFRMEGKIMPSQQPGKENRVYRNPLGVIGIISPWNFPFHLAIRSIAPALATGNAVVIKPATDTPVTGGLLFASLFEAAGLPKGLLNVVVGRGSEIGDDIVTHPTPRLISFTGSTPVGKHIGELAGGPQPSLVSRVAYEHPVPGLELRGRVVDPAEGGLPVEEEDPPVVDLVTGEGIGIPGPTGGSDQREKQEERQERAHKRTLSTARMGPLWERTQGGTSAPRRAPRVRSPLDPSGEPA